MKSIETVKNSKSLFRNKTQNLESTLFKKEHDKQDESSFGDEDEEKMEDISDLNMEMKESKLKVSNF